MKNSSSGRNLITDFKKVFHFYPTFNGWGVGGDLTVFLSGGACNDVSKNKTFFLFLVFSVLPHLQYIVWCNEKPIKRVID